MSGGRIADGDCGAAVVDQKTGAIYGHIVLGSVGTSLAYVVPAVEVIAHIRRRFPNQPVSVPEPDELHHALYGGSVELGSSRPSLSVTAEPVVAPAIGSSTIPREEPPDARTSPDLIAENFDPSPLEAPTNQTQDEENEEATKLRKSFHRLSRFLDRSFQSPSNDKEESLELVPVGEVIPNFSSSSGVKVWHAGGEGLRHGYDLVHEIQELLDGLDPTAAAVQGLLFCDLRIVMVGKTAKATKPRILVWGVERSGYKRLVKEVKKSGILARYPGFKLFYGGDPEGLLL